MAIGSCSAKPRSRSISAPRRPLAASRRLLPNQPTDLHANPPGRPRMPNETPVTRPPDGQPIGSKRGGLMRPIGSLRDALIAAGRDDRRITQIVDRGTTEPRRDGAREEAHEVHDAVTARAPSDALPPPRPLPDRREARLPRPLSPRPHPREIHRTMALATSRPSPPPGCRRVAITRSAWSSPR